MIGLGLVIKPVIKKKKEPVKRKLFNGKRLEALCIIENNIYYAIVKTKDGELKLEFTDKSYSLLNRDIVFSKTKDEHGKYIRFIRNKIQSLFFPGSSDNFVPFSNNWVINGYIVKINGKEYFDFVDLVCPKLQYNRLRDT